MREPPLDEPEVLPYATYPILVRLRRSIKFQKDRARWEEQQLEEQHLQCMMEDEEREWAIAQMCDEGTYFEPQEYK